MYELRASTDFEKVYKKLTKGNPTLQKQFKKTFKLLRDHPFYPSLKTHKVSTKKYDDVWSSMVSGDVRIIWAFNEKEGLVILILETGTHSGSHKVYRKKSS